MCVLSWAKRLKVWTFKFNILVVVLLTSSAVKTSHHVHLGKTAHDVSELRKNFIQHRPNLFKCDALRREEMEGIWKCSPQIDQIALSVTPRVDGMQHCSAGYKVNPVL